MEYTVSFCTLGCRVNQYESSVISVTLEEKGIKTVPFGETCDFALVNTCTVTAESDRKSRQMIRRAAKYAQKGVIVTGCFAEISPADAEAIDGVIKVIGNRNKSSVVNAVLSAAGLVRESSESSDTEFEKCSGFLKKPGRVRTFIKIEDGCESKCAYCIIPKARGPVRSKGPCCIIEEASLLTAAGSPEIILTGIEISAYGKDLEYCGDKYDLSRLISDMSNIPTLRRLGLGSLDPSVMSEEFLGKISNTPQLLRHFHISLQSGCSSVLARMRRKYNADQARTIIDRIRRYFPDANISADIIVGFPGETEAEFEETSKFCRDADFLNLHIFPYSVREGTEAALMQNQLPEAEKKRRVLELEKIHQTTKAELLKRYADTHSCVNVLFEQKKTGVLVGHSEHYVEFKVPGSADLVGKICQVKPNSDGTGILI